MLNRADRGMVRRRISGKARDVVGKYVYCQGGLHVIRVYAAELTIPDGSKAREIAYTFSFPPFRRDFSLRNMHVRLHPNGKTLRCNIKKKYNLYIGGIHYSRHVSAQLTLTYI